VTTWWQAVASLRESREAGVLVTVTDVRGHAPREAGAKMVVAARRTWGSVGGGNVEAEAVRRARALLDGGGTRPESFVSHLSDKASSQPDEIRHGVQCCGGEVSVLLEPLPVVPSVAIFGAGHVGLELARILARHHLDLHLVDSRAAHLSAEALAPLADSVAGVHVHAVPVLPELVLAELPPGTHLLVMTHDHAEDVAICDAAIRLDHLGPIGLIGSSAKLVRFRSRLLADGHAEEAVDRIRTPIGLAGITTSKEPAAIAVAVAAELLVAFAREGSRKIEHGLR
jgi:xanthine dehydrogenase accessory factor